MKVALKSTRGKGDVPCENGCIGKSSSETHHGTTLMLVLAKRGVVDLKATLRYSYNGKPCSDREKRGLPPNDEKGLFHGGFVNVNENFICRDRAKRF